MGLFQQATENQCELQNTQITSDEVKTKHRWNTQRFRYTGSYSCPEMSVHRRWTERAYAGANHCQYAVWQFSQRHVGETYRLYYGGDAARRQKIRSYNSGKRSTAADGSGYRGSPCYAYTWPKMQQLRNKPQASPVSSLSRCLQFLRCYRPLGELLSKEAAKSTDP